MVRSIVVATLLVVGLSASLVGGAAARTKTPPKTTTTTSQPTTTSTTSQPTTTSTTSPPTTPFTPITADCPTSGATGSSATTVYTPAVQTNGADQTAVIQAALNTATAHGGGVVKLPAGMITDDGHLEMGVNDALVGAGESATTIVAGSTFLSAEGPYGGYPIITTDAAHNTTVADLTLDQSANTLGTKAATEPGRLAGYLLEARDSTNTLFVNITTEQPLTYSIVAVGSSGFCFDDDATTADSVSVLNQLDGIHVLNSSNGDLRGDNIDQCSGSSGDDGVAIHTIGGSDSNVAVVGDTICGGLNGAAMDLAETDSSDSISDVTVENDTFANSPNEGIYNGCFTSCGSVSHVTVEDNTFTNNGWTDGGNATDLDYGPAGLITYTLVEDNNACGSGAFNLETGTGNANSGNNADDC